jgi:L-ascorbate metabolism protein UlaG (beta-lactamase superfamily)
VVRSAAALVFGALAAALALGSCVFSAPRYRGPVSDHFDGEKFLNQVPTAQAGWGDFLKWQQTRDPGPWRPFTDSSPGKPPPRSVEKGEMRVTFVNHATVLLQVDGVNILTDPIWSERASPVQFAGPSRALPPGIRFEDLPPIDVVLLSHNHYDHMDAATLKRLFAAFKPRVFCGLGNAQFLSKIGVLGATDLDWWQTAMLPNGLKLTAVPAQHFSNRGISDRNATLWVGFVVESKDGYAYFAGDTGFGPHFQQIRERFGSPRLAMLPIGAFRPEWFMAPVHVSPKEAVKAHQLLGAAQSMGIHFGTFRLADDGQDEPVEKLRAALTEAGEPEERFWALANGEGRQVAPLRRPLENTAEKK